MAQLAIWGHKTRGKKVIKILEMLGGKNKYLHFGESESYFFFIQDGVIDCAEVKYTDNYRIFTLEEFLEKFPYKVGDKVSYVKYGDACSSVYTILRMRWTGTTIEYLLDSSEFSALTKDLQPYKEAPMYLNEKANKQFEEIKKILESVKEIMEERDKAKAPDLKGEDYSFRRFGYKIPNGYEFECVRDNEIILKPIKLFPKTYEECCDILDAEPYGRSAGYKSDLITAFRNLLICRDAYWKIAGEQIGLGKPWEPAIQDTIWGITRSKDEIEKYSYRYGKTKLLEFPTEEMRDEFYENFKELIELCKELL